MNNELAHLAKHAVPVVPYTEETQHLTVHL